MSAMGFGKHSSDCACCKGPAAWSVLLPSLTPLAPAASRDTLVVSATNQPEVVKSSKWDWLRLPNWALPTRAVPLTLDDDDSPVPLDVILAGRTKSPIRVEDLRAFVRNDNHVQKDSSRALEFLLTYNSYRAAFFALSPEKQAPHPYAALQGPSLADKAAEIQSRFPPGSVSDGPARPTAAAHPTNPTQAYPHLNPDFQPLRQELQNIIDLYLQPHSLSPVTSLVSTNILRQALSDAKLTTHPSALDPVASNVHSHLTTDVLPRFLDHAVSNLSATTSRGRMLIACIAFAAALVLEVFLIMYRTGRPARLFAVPLWVLAIGYAIGSQTGLCFWLAWRGTREHKPYEVGTPLNSPKEPSFKAPVAAKEPQRPLALLSRFKLLARRPPQAPPRPRTLAEKGELPPLPVEADLEAAFEKGHSRRNTSVGSRESFAPLIESKEDGLFKKIMRFTGTAVDTVAVEDSRVRKLQAMVGARVAVWLILGTSLVIGVVMAIP